MFFDPATPERSGFMGSYATEDEARAEVTRLNRGLNAREGVPVKAPFKVYFYDGPAKILTGHVGDYGED